MRSSKVESTLEGLGAHSDPNSMVLYAVKTILSANEVFILYGPYNRP